MENYEPRRIEAYRKNYAEAFAATNGQAIINNARMAGDFFDDQETETKSLMIQCCLRLLACSVIGTCTVSGRVEMSSMDVWYRQVAMGLHQSVIEEEGEVTEDISEWSFVAGVVSRGDTSSGYLKRTTNGLAIIPGFPVVDGFEKTKLHQFQGSRLIAISRQRVFEKHRDDPSIGGRYVILHRPDPPEIWSLWLEEELAEKVLGSLGDYDPTQQPFPFPGTGEPVFDNRQGFSSAEFAMILTGVAAILMVWGISIFRRKRAER